MSGPSSLHLFTGQIESGTSGSLSSANLCALLKLCRHFKWYGFPSPEENSKPLAISAGWTGLWVLCRRLLCQLDDKAMEFVIDARWSDAVYICIPIPIHLDMTVLQVQIIVFVVSLESSTIVPSILLSSITSILIFRAFEHFQLTRMKMVTWSMKHENLVCQHDSTLSDEISQSSWDS